MGIHTVELLNLDKDASLPDKARWCCLLSSLGVACAVEGCAKRCSRIPHVCRRKPCPSSGMLADGRTTWPDRRAVSNGRRTRQLHGINSPDKSTSSLSGTEHTNRRVRFEDPSPTGPPADIISAKPVPDAAYGRESPSS